MMTQGLNSSKEASSRNIVTSQKSRRQCFEDSTARSKLKEYIVSATPKDIYMYMYNYRSHTFRDLLLVNPVTKKEVGTPPLLLLVIVHPRRGLGGK